jgi:hypothetical protein
MKARSREAAAEYGRRIEITLGDFLVESNLPHYYAF